MNLPDAIPLPWLGIAGPTASGKTALALAVADQLDVEIISVDSALIYRGMDIGTAKPSAEELSRVPHHLIDILPPTQSYSAAQFVRDAQALIADIHQRGRWPLLVGGTMLYFRALMEGLHDLPTASAELRSQIENRAEQQGWPALHAELTLIDPVTAQRLAPHDGQRIQRALEVYELTGQPMSVLWQTSQASRGWPALQLISLEPDDRAWLHERIESRFKTMLEQGFIEEVRQLRQQPDLHLELPSMRCVGYRQVWEALDACERQGNDQLTSDALKKLQLEGVAATRQLAKRQLTWLRSTQPRLTISPQSHDFLKNACKSLITMTKNAFIKP